MVTLKSLMAGIGLALVAAAGANAQTLDCGTDTLCKIKAAGVLKIGTKDDYVPWSYRASDGSFKGMEVDIGTKIAEALGVKPEFVKVTSANRFEFLAQGQIDLMIASASDTAERRKVVAFVHPNYYSSGYTVLLPKAVKATQWKDISGQTLCAVQGAWYNKPAQEKFGVTVLAFAGTAETEAAMTQGRCIGLLEDDNQINVRLNNPKWADYHMPLPIEADTPWGMAVRQSDQLAPFGIYIAGSIAQMHRDGTLLKLEGDNGIAKSAYLVRMHESLKDHID
ncbi:amino acid ABC transporter substrate-binding protein (PAAT family) [Ancylobacter aquaticus]|uniref:Amino acid ABC transporter substrate-binding protein (PAAT family) n=1 Tax=Ancylobacter aquaticus TaxID=100 RepID=A0A4R1I5X2_ANCAQ|nr:transporter substrate-binding domain-containing protein [Ancylobacter aquaticus]TCK28039.1 amino acid ABC transporter substrate-binding protein (PAAT family) [Ancylobacter aquaticus]